MAPPVGVLGRTPAVAWAGSLALIAVRAFGVAKLLSGETAYFDLTLCAWLALGTLPFRNAETGPAERIASALALALGPLALAVGLDARGDLSGWLAEHGGRVAIGIVLLVVLRASASLAAGPGVRERARAIAAWGWLLLVPGWAALEVALGFAGRTAADAGTTPRYLSPLGWCVGVGGGGGAALAGVLALLAAVAFLGRGTREVR
ncbi:MAG TPA: hypothetical protein ENJ09_05620 [Planctomycetes bacterium]|nr:hypothetical protein [Planctomycetota bacterium]